LKLFLGLILFVGYIYAATAQYNRGELLYYSKGCNGCHGSSAEGGGSFPRLANKNKNYLIKRLYYFKQGKSSNQMQQMMIPFALKLSDAQIKDLAMYLSEHKIEETEELSDDLMGGVGS